MGSVNDEITRIAGAKAAIEGAIEYCGVDVLDGSRIETYAERIMQIPAAVFSQFNSDEEGGEDEYIKSIKQENGVISATTGGLASSSSSGLMSSDQFNKLEGISAGAEVNQNAFSKVTITNNNGGSTAASIEANSKTDTLNLTAGTNIKINADSTNDKITITNTYSHPTNTARDVGPDSAQSPSFGGTFSIVSGITSDTLGHVTGATEHNVTIPALPNVTVTDKGNTVAASAGNEMVEVVQTLANGTTSSNTNIYVDYTTVEVPTKTYVDNAITNGIEVSKAMILKGSKKGSGGDFENATTFSQGDTFVVSTAHTDSKLGVLEVGDLVVANKDGASKTNAADWIVLQKNVDLVGGQNTVGLVKNGSSVTSTSGLTAAPIINGVPYYKNTTYDLATTSANGLVKLFRAKGSANVTVLKAPSSNNKKYAVDMDYSGRIYVDIPWTDTTYSSGTGISISGTTINHSNSVTAVTTAGLLKVKYDAQGHITGSSAITKSDITGLGIPGANYYPSRSYSSGLQISTTNDSTNYPAGALFVPNATASQSGVVTSEAQTFGGEKTFSSDLIMKTSSEIKFYNDSNCIYGGSSYLQIDGGSSIYFGLGGTDRLRLSTSALYPLNTTTSTIDLGTITSKFGNVYAASIGTSSYRCTYGYFSESVRATNGFYQSSDETLKMILKPLEVNLDDLSKLRKTYYLWKDDSDKRTHLGMIAQDVQKVYPELVDVDKETGLLSLAYDKLSVVALAAVDKLQEEIGSLKKKNSELEDRISKLENLLLYGKGY